MDSLSRRGFRLFCLTALCIHRGADLDICIHTVYDGRSYTKGARSDAAYVFPFVIRELSRRINNPLQTAVSDSEVQPC